MTPPRILLVVLSFCAAALQATTVLPPSFDELVAGADQIVRGQVVEVKMERQSSKPGQPPVVVTKVKVAVERTLAGDEQETVELVFLGGEVADEKLTVIGQPQFLVGDREILFVQGNGIQMSPLVAMGHGRYMLVDEAGEERVVRNDGAPLLATASVSKPLPHSENGRAVVQRATLPAALTREAFEKQITERAAVVRKAGAPSSRGAGK